MTLLLAHPEAEDLGRFVEGTLDEPERAAIVDHLADCDDCRILVVDAAEFAEPVVVHSDWRRWSAVAAALVIVVAGAGFLYTETRNPLAKFDDAWGQLKSRPIETRLSGVAYVPRNTMRGAGDETDLALLILQGEAEAATSLHGDNAKTLHARGVGFLVNGKLDESLPLLQAAVTKEPDNPRYLNDLAAALIVAERRKDNHPEKTDTAIVGTPKEYVPIAPLPSNPSGLQRAVAICDRVIQLDPPSPEALFNRAIAWELIGNREETRKAYDRYLAVDSSSGWAREIRQRLDLLQSTPPSA